MKKFAWEFYQVDKKEKLDAIRVILELNHLSSQQDIIDKIKELFKIYN